MRAPATVTTVSAAWAWRLVRGRTGFKLAAMGAWRGNSPWAISSNAGLDMTSLLLVGGLGPRALPEKKH
jgi:hypothetical protein